MGAGGDDMTLSSVWSAPTLGEALDVLAASTVSGNQDIRFPDRPGGDERISLAELAEGSKRFAHGLLSGPEPGDVVGILLPPGPEFLIAWFGVIRTGSAATVLPVTAVHPTKQAVHLKQLVDVAGLKTVVTGPEYESVASELRKIRPGLRLITVGASTPGGGALPTLEPESAAFVQFTSGSTRAPRGVLLTHANIMAGLTGIVCSGEMTATDVWAQWTPLYHDMGLFGMMSGLLSGMQVNLVAPQTFIRRPERFLQVLADTGATITTGPNFSYDLIARVARAHPDLVAGLDLSRWRLAINGGEVLSPQTLENFDAALAPAGVGPSVMFPAYGMAEATLAITFSQPGSRPATLWADRDLLAECGVVRTLAAGDPAATGLVSAGRPVAGLEVRITGGDGSQCAEDQLGEIQVRGGAVTAGYYRDPGSTAELFDGSWLRTGDLGFWHEGQLYVGGRRKEMVIVNGRNYFPSDAEHVARTVPGVYRGRAIAFADTEHAADGRVGEYVGLIVESDCPETDYPVLIERVRKQVIAELDLSAVRVHPVSPGFLTRSTSGKWQRLAAAARLADGGHTYLPTK